MPLAAAVLPEVRPEGCVHRTSVLPKPAAQRFEGAFLGAPQQGHDPIAIRARRSSDQIPLLIGEVIGDKRRAARLDGFEITPHLSAGPARWHTTQRRGCGSGREPQAHATRVRTPLARRSSPAAAQSRPTTADRGEGSNTRRGHISPSIVRGASRRAVWEYAVHQGGHVRARSTTHPQTARRWRSVRANRRPRATPPWPLR